MFSCDGLTQVAQDFESKRDPRSFVKSTRLKILKSIDEQVASNKLDYWDISQEVIKFKCTDHSIGECMMESAMMSGSRCMARGRVKKKPAPNLGLLLARVQMG